LHLDSEIKKLPSYRALSTQKKTGCQLVESLDAKKCVTGGSKPVVANTPVVDNEQFKKPEGYLDNGDPPHN
ncbi:hypothetical protein Tco_1379628, partial [Tanacetum coccineum]